MEDPLADIPYISAPPTLQHSIIGCALPVSPRPFPQDLTDGISAPRPCVAGYQTQVLLCGILLQQVVAYWGELKHHSKLSKYTAVVVVTLNVVYTALCFEDGFTLACSSISPSRMACRRLRYSSSNSAFLSHQQRAPIGEQTHCTVAHSKVNFCHFATE